MLKRLTIGKKLIISGVVTTALVAMILTGIALWQGTRVERIAESETLELALQGQEHIVAGIMAMLATQQEVLQEKVTTDLNVARDVLEQTGMVSFGHEMVDWQAVNQFSGSQTRTRLPKMMAGDLWLGQNADISIPSPVVDRTRALVGGTCTIFQRMNDQGDMLRVATNVETLDKKRAIGTYIPARNPDGTPNPVLQRVLAGERFTGRAFVVDRWYVTAYEPIRDHKGNVVGVLYSGVPEESAASLRREIMNVRVGESGYVFVLDPEGNYIISHNGARDGENAWEMRDAAGNLFIQEIVNRGKALKAGEFAQTQYKWKGEADPYPRQQTVSIGFFEPWQWIISAGTWDHEIFQGAHMIQNANSQSRMVMLGVLGIALSAVVLVWLFLARSIVGPIRRTVDMLKDISEGEGDLTKRLEAKSKDEIGDMADYFNRFVGKLQGIIRQIAEGVQTLSASSTELSAISEQMSQAAQNTSDKSNVVASASEEMSANMTTVAAAMEQSATNTHAVATAAEQMSATVNEIAKNSER
ncbi:MAG: methyl-accepting chemotaxis protein, partial [Desulfatitalea sp.]|nr:methyl-accepting chemotaxis protein [Desulfatitalea sp.]